MGKKKIIVAVILVMGAALLLVLVIAIFSAQAHAINYYKDGVFYKDVMFKVISISKSDDDLANELNGWAGTLENSEYFIIDRCISEKKVLIIYIDLRDQPASVRKLFVEK